nr:unnamed protein product [Callosobruchus analis]CAI5837191.1 unnamed protein product [Callosobruchus analis]CAI5849543.1 unnamed protein product [Callosobruchus analis]CAI5854190.1 unnamed protein product [Callosobruchus analis]
MFSPFPARKCSGKNGHPQYIGITS